jgi:hypothetical protein
MPLLLLNQIVKDHIAAVADTPGHMLPNVCSPTNQPTLVCQWTEADKAGLNPSWNRLPYQPLATRSGFLHR